MVPPLSVPPDAVVRLAPGVPVDVAATLRPLQRGAADPTVRAAPTGVWLTRRERVDGATLPATLLVSPQVRGEVTARAWGPGAAAALAGLPALLGLHDTGWDAFDALLAPDPRRPSLPHALREARRTREGLRLPAAGHLSTQLMTVVLEQKVTHDQARHGWRTLVRLAHGIDDATPPGPAPAGMLLPPTPRAVLAIPSWDWHARAWVQPAQSRTVLEVARRASAVDRLGAAVAPGDVAGTAALAARLQAIPGVGPWSAAEALQRSHGSADLVSVGDFHLAHLVGQVLAGRRTDDAGMLRLLQPWEGHRQRVVRMIGASGASKERFGPRLAPADHRAY
ncbi:3-methyladenine DNA glycosylase [Micrococcus porci]|uniref:DNA-3-methyladenine glycosylase family protein n=1 Tax=Micrococcus TaxID=1269 RepID=UPI001CD00828|nr:MULTISPECIES: 3-methyladenine DNA glycosylase [Micrococcus]MCG7422299.1 3-methyladenine DNA glycosylase [Micrococcus sp. ACRRV]UBH25586.1 3-methyladenine DNA glycosylase [Micrococcus porci]